MDQDPRLELDIKEAETPTLEEVRRRSVQDRAEGEARSSFGRGVSYWLTWPATDAEAMPEWPNAARDAKLRDWWWRIPLLSAVVTTFVSRISTLPIKVEADDEDDAAYWRWVLTNADFGRGWKTCIGKFTLDLLTQDNGSFLEVIRPARTRGAKGLMPVHRLGPDTYAVRTPGGDYVRLGKLSAKAVTDDPWDTPIGVAHLDSGKCSRQLDPETPVVYSSKKGPRPLKFYQVFDASWMTSSREDDAHYGMCPVTLCQVAARIAKNVDTYVDEKVGGRYFKRIIWATNVFQADLEKAIKDAEAQADARGQTRYVTNVVVGAADVTSPGEVGVLDLTGLPDGFDRETEYDIAADLITGCFGLDRPEVIPMRTATLGQAGQVGVMALKAKGKGVAEVIALIERFLAQWVLPQDGSVRATLDFTDDEEDARRAAVQKDKAQTVAAVCGTPTADGTPPYTRAEVRALHEYYELVPEKMLTPEEKEETPAVEEEGGKKIMDVKARPNRRQCMAVDCASAPVIDVQWADGRGRAWFCLPDFEAWADETEREIVRAWFVEGGVVPKKVKDYSRSVQVRTLGSGVGPKEMADRIKKLMQKRGKKAADEPPPPNVRGKPLPKEEAAESWEITEEDMATAQRWVDKAMKEAGFRD